MGKIDSISKALETDHGFDLSTGKIVPVLNHHNISTNNEVADLVEINDIEVDERDDIDELEEFALSEEYQEDERKVKQNIRELIDKSMDMTDELIELVRISESPKAFDNISNFLRTVVELNDKLLDTHERKFKRKIEETKAKQSSNKSRGVNVDNGGTVNTQTNNNTIICTDPAEILKTLHGKKGETE